MTCLSYTRYRRSIPTGILTKHVACGGSTPPYPTHPNVVFLDTHTVRVWANEGIDSRCAQTSRLTRTALTVLVRVFLACVRVGAFNVQVLIHVRVADAVGAVVGRGNHGALDGGGRGAGGKKKLKLLPGE